MRAGSGRAGGAAYIPGMPRVHPGRSRLMVRMCPRCGYDGAEMQGEAGRRRYECPLCRGDLYTRPPRSYAEMEGLEVAAARAEVAMAAASGRWAAPDRPPPGVPVHACPGVDARAIRRARYLRALVSASMFCGLLLLSAAAFAAAALLAPA